VAEQVGFRQVALAVVHLSYEGVVEAAKIRLVVVVAALLVEAVAELGVVAVMALLHHLEH
jgi:hypothetical protein